jgi:hypothetical protein
MRLCQKCRNDATRWYWKRPDMPESEIPMSFVPDSECEFWAHRLLNKATLVRCQIYHPDNGKYAPVHYHTSPSVRYELIKEWASRPEPNTTTQNPERYEPEKANE